MIGDKPDDGSDNPVGYVTSDGELEVVEDAEYGRYYKETALGQHQRWLRQAPDLYEKYQELLTATAMRKSAERPSETPDLPKLVTHLATVARANRSQIQAEREMLEILQPVFAGAVPSPAPSDRKE